MFHCSVINVHFSSPFLAAHVFYHVVFGLSRTFLTFFEVLFQFLLTFVRRNSDRIPHLFLDVNRFLHFFQNVFSVVFSVRVLSNTVQLEYHLISALSTGFLNFFEIYIFSENSIQFPQLVQKAVLTSKRHRIRFPNRTLCRFSLFIHYIYP